jgi:hypothetical protein
VRCGFGFNAALPQYRVRYRQLYRRQDKSNLSVFALHIRLRHLVLVHFFLGFRARGGQRRARRGANKYVKQLTRGSKHMGGDARGPKGGWSR